MHIALIKELIEVLQRDLLRLAEETRFGGGNARRFDVAADLLNSVTYELERR